MDDFMTSDDMPQGLTTGEAAAATLHEAFRNLVRAGFTPREAIMYLVEVGMRKRDEE